jgi:cytochrome c oxidase subunit 4
MAHAATADGQQHPIRLYLVVWAWLFVLSACSYLVDFFGLQGMLRWALILIFMALKAGLIIAIFMHLAWERLALTYAILLPPLVVLVFIGIMVFEAHYTLFTRAMCNRGVHADEAAFRQSNYHWHRPGTLRHWGHRHSFCAAAGRNAVLTDAVDMREPAWFETRSHATLGWLCRGGDGTFGLSPVRRVWTETLARQSGRCPRATARTSPSRPWPVARRSATWLPSTG